MNIPAASLTLAEINGMSRSEFVRSLGGIFEHSPWVAEEAYSRIPFSSIEQLHHTMLGIARNAERASVEALLRAHPDLATKMQVTPLSAAEQQGAGLDRLTTEEYRVLQELNRIYTDKFNFPFILAVRGKNKDDIIQAMGERVNRTLEQEMEQALAEIGRITRFRLDDLLAEEIPEAAFPSYRKELPLSGRLTTHVLDLARGIPAAGLALQLRRLGEGAGELLREAVTNADGRLEKPLLEGPELLPGGYELLFMAGDYFRQNNSAAAAEPDVLFFLENIPIRFNIVNPADHYHVPLLVAPGGYSTYRGS